MADAKEGMYGAIMFGTLGTLAYLTGIELSWSQEKKLFYPMGSVEAASTLHGVKRWEGSFKQAFTNTNMLGTFNLGTWTGTGTIYPRSGTNPYIAGTFSFLGGNISNMASESIDASQETHNFRFYNVTIQA